MDLYQCLLSFVVLVLSLAMFMLISTLMLLCMTRIARWIDRLEEARIARENKEAIKLAIKKYGG